MTNGRLRHSESQKTLPYPHMNRISIIALLLFAVGGSAADRPDIIYILADNLDYGDLGCYGQETLNTPAIDRMAESKAFFKVTGNWFELDSEVLYTNFIT